MVACQHPFFQERWSRAENNILISIRLVETWSITTVKFPLREDVVGTSWIPIHDVILLPAQALVGSGRSGRVEIVFVAYKNIQDFISPEDHFSVSTNFDDTQNSMVVNKTQIINSRVLSASIDRYRMVRLHQPVTIILKHLQEENVTNPQCVYLEFSTRHWSAEGCWIIETNKSHTKCSCNHLTNFALIMDISPNKIEKDNLLTVEIVTIVGCGIAIFFLLVTFVTLHFIRGVKDDRHVIQKNTCFCLVVSEVVFIGGIDKVMSRVICGVVAGLLHYLFLTAFMWMFLESLQLLLMSLEKKNYNGTARRRWRWYYCSGYGLPIISVGVCAIINPQTYGTKSYCWLEIDNFIIFGFVGPALVCVLVSFTFLCIVTARVCRKIDRSLTCKNKEQSKFVNLRSWCRHSVCILILLSLTLGLAQWFLLWKTSLTGYLFTTVNSIQGLFIFILFCLRNSKVRKELMKARCCSRWLTDCCRKPHSGQSNLYVHTNGQMTLPPPNAISGHHTLAQGLWRSIKEQQKENQVDIMDATTPDLPFIPMVGFRAHDHVVRNTRLGNKFGLCSELNSENGYFCSSFSTSRKYSDREQELRNEATSSVYYFRPNHKYETIDQEFTINNYRLRPRVEPECDNEFGLLAACDIAIENPSKHRPMKQHESGPENAAKSALSVALTSSTRSRNLSLFRDGYLRPHVAYSGINSPTESERSFSSLVNDQSSVSLSSSSSSPHKSSSNSPSHETGAENKLLQSLPNLETSEEYGFSTFSNVLKFPSDNTALNCNFRVESDITQPMES
ncbi:adhesion G protein-coupled receptor L1-like isoform X2 [Limulus polyphemus]|uniref:Adhesion G protein-coupled receptor L1-like isoform X2 n=1 Tax=Limulus polyphemus TaxID=6850 RepID=A0ABM1S0F2_LIMPO|nr:adhesion G protein-coupled receptor L1-like isoform X2 [Limulus polyphemus]